jgi:hypothetical protein
VCASACDSPWPPFCGEGQGEKERKKALGPSIEHSVQLEEALFSHRRLSMSPASAFARAGYWLSRARCCWRAWRHATPTDSSAVPIVKSISTHTRGPVDPIEPNHRPESRQSIHPFTFLPRSPHPAIGVRKDKPTKEDLAWLACLLAWLACLRWHLSRPVRTRP